ncbi:dynein heavy chain 1, axonemal [Elysia marginata]|uniref:Dynein heavy chain 1, axonemal n=1 Tax=Elysia marginata TaxID=1093978 RepID=A0AAV4JRP9_9GAST|nr:dynein heavy chain 1, axonemal [Elysia marginata]
MEGITQGIREQGDRRVLIKSSAVRAVLAASQQNRLKIRQTFGNSNLTKEEEEEKKNKPLYAEIAEWRKVLARLSCFLRTVDYILQDLLRHLVFSAAQRLLDHLVTSYHAQDDEDSDEEDLDSVCLKGRRGS